MKLVNKEGTLVKKMSVIFILMILMFGSIVLANIIDEPSDVNSYDNWRFEYTNMDKVWDDIDSIPYRKGEKNEIIVAIIDTGVDLDHPDLNVVSNGYDFYNNDNTPEDGQGHGTHIAGIIGAKKNSGTDNVVGIAPGVQIMPLQVTSSNGSLDPFVIDDAINYAIDNGADVINMSIDYPFKLSKVVTALERARSEGVVVVVASGNLSNHWEDGEVYHQKFAGDSRFKRVIKYPAIYESVITTGSVRKHPSKDELGISDYSNVAGEVDGSYRSIDVVAPGSYIWSTKRGDSSTGIVKSGTSMAAPHVVGLVVLLKAKYPELTVDQIEEIIKDNAYDPGIVLPSGYNRKDTIGAGLIDINASINFSPLKTLSINEAVDFDFDSQKYNYLVTVDEGVESITFNATSMGNITFDWGSSQLNQMNNYEVDIREDITVLSFGVSIPEMEGETRTYKIFVRHEQPLSSSRITSVNVVNTDLDAKVVVENMDYYITHNASSSVAKIKVNTKSTKDKISFVSATSMTDFIYDSTSEYDIELTGDTTLFAIRVKTEAGEITSYLLALLRGENGTIYTYSSEDVSPVIITNTVNIRLDTDAVVLDYGVDADSEFTSHNFNATVSGTSKKDVIWTLDDNHFVTIDEYGVVRVKEDIPDGTGDFSVTLKVQSVVGGAVATADILFLEKTPLGSIQFFDPYVSGYDDGTFKPKNPVSRAEVAAMFAKILNLKINDSGEMKFSDVSGTHWAYPYIKIMYETKIFSGYSDGTFRPNNPISRAEIAQAFTNYWNYVGVEVNPKHMTDIPDVHDTHWAADPIHRLYNTRIFTGYLHNAYGPDDDTLREQLVGMINKLIDRDPFDDSIQHFEDVPKSYFYFGDIEAASQFYIQKYELPD